MQGAGPQRDWHLAQVNLVRLAATRGDRRMQPFFGVPDPAIEHKPGSWCVGNA
jgi:hypothetical protein